MHAVLALLGGCGTIGPATVTAPGSVRRTSNVLPDPAARAAAAEK